MNEPHILLVEDEPIALHTMARYLQRIGFSVATASDGQEALARCAETTPAAIVTDLRMPRGGGLELIQTVRSSWPDLPIVVMTGYGTDEAERTAREAGANAVLRKPVSIAELGAMLQDITGTVRS